MKLTFHRIFPNRILRYIVIVGLIVVPVLVGLAIITLKSDSDPITDQIGELTTKVSKRDNKSTEENDQNKTTNSSVENSTQTESHENDPPQNSDGTANTNTGSPSPSPSPNPSPSPSPNPAPNPSTPSCNGQTHVAGGSDGSGGCWPGPDNTGVPDGVVLSTYSGPTTFSNGTTTIDSKLIYDDLVVTGSGNLVVKNSKMIAHFDADTATGTLTIIDSEIDGTSWVGATVGFQNVTIVRSNIYGSQHSVLCGDNCSVTDSWLHDQHEHNGDHNNAYISNGGSNVTLRHNTLHCTPTGSIGGGCSSNASFFGDFATITNIAIDSNLLLATPSGGYCTYLGHDPPKTYGSNPSNVVVTNNFFQKGSSGKCGITAAVTSFLNANGNVFSGNKFTDGTTVSY